MWQKQKQTIPLPGGHTALGRGQSIEKDPEKRGAGYINQEREKEGSKECRKEGKERKRGRRQRKEGKEPRNKTQPANHCYLWTRSSG